MSRAAAAPAFAAVLAGYTPHAPQARPETLRLQLAYLDATPLLFEPEVDPAAIRPMCPAGTAGRAEPMSRRSTRQHVIDSRRFPMRMCIAVLPGGFGARLNDVHAWLSACYRRDGYGM